MKVCVIGAGYVGLVTAACFAEQGNIVHCIENNDEKLQILQSGKCPIYEPGLQEMLASNISAGRLTYASVIDETSNMDDFYFIAVGTPMGENGCAKLDYVVRAAEDIGQNIMKDTIVVIKSTVPIGTSKKVRAIIEKSLQMSNRSFRIAYVSNPEFLKEGSAIKDCVSPDRVIIGTDDKHAIESMKELYAHTVRNSDRFIFMDNESAEMSKYASNAMLATRISFMNEIAAICEATGADINAVRLGIGSDKRIGYSFLYAGCGYGGSCFPKDVQALIYTAKTNGCSADILEKVENTNKRQKNVLIKKALERFDGDIKGRVFSMWGLSFKPNTDDVREAPALEMIRMLLEYGATVHAFDPVVKDSAISETLGSSEGFFCFSDKYEAVRGTDALFIATEWSEFRSPDFGLLKKLLREPIVFDGRNLYNTPGMKKWGLEYHCVGRRMRK